MSRKLRQPARAIPLACVAVALVATSARGQTAPSVRLALQGATQGKISGASSGFSADQIEAFAFAMSEPYGAATPVVHVTAEAYAAPRLLQALATNEVIVNPTITFVKPGRNGSADSVAYRIKAPHGNIIGATLVLDTHRVPSITFDLLLSGGVNYTTGGTPTPMGWSMGGTATTSNAPTPPTATTTPPPTVSGNVPSGAGVQIIGKFVGQKSGTFPSDPAAGRSGGILLDSVALSMTTPVSNGVAAGRAVVHPLVIARPASADASSFAAAHASGETFTKIDVIVNQSMLNGAPTETIEIENDGVCDVTSAGCGTASGMPAGQPGASAGLGGGQRAQTMLSAPVTRIAGVSGTAVMQLRPTVIKVTNRSNNTIFAYTP